MDHSLARVRFMSIVPDADGQKPGFYILRVVN
jgi:hypothetical protein